MANTKMVYGKFSDVTGTECRHVYDVSGNLLGVIRKVSEGYRVYRTTDGKVRTKRLLADAFKTIKRRN